MRADTVEWTILPRRFRGRASRCAMGSFALVLGTGGCGSSPTETGPEAPVAVANFDALWTNFDRHYSFFIVKGIDWDDVRQRFQPQVTGETTEGELWSVATEMLAVLEDGHVSLESPRFGRWTYTGWYDAYPENFDLGVVRDRYLGGALESTPDGRLLFGRLDDAVGYIHVPGFGGGRFGFLQELGARLADVEALVIDVRNNGGGSDLNGREIAGHFADRRRLFRIIRWRNGPEHDDFDPPVEDFIEPLPPHFPGPVAVLTNRRVFSSAEGFVLMMRILPQVVVVGDTTGGGSANPQEFTLPNGWRHRVSRWWVQTPDGESFEGVGLAPDVAVQISPEDRAAGRDTILERALAVLHERLAGVPGGARREP